MRNTAITKALEEIAKDIIWIVQAVMDKDEIGENIKVKRNTLKGSNLQKEIETKVFDIDNCIIHLLVNDYIQYVERGRERYHKPNVPIDAIREWAIRKGIPTDNSTLFAIQRSIFNLGIRPRPIMYYVFEEIDKMFNDVYFDQLFEYIIEELNNNIN